MLALQVNSLAVHLNAYNADIAIFDNQLILSLEMLAFLSMQNAGKKLLAVGTCLQPAVTLGLQVNSNLVQHCGCFSFRLNLFGLLGLFLRHIFKIINRSGNSKIACREHRYRCQACKALLHRQLRQTRHFKAACTAADITLILQLDVEADLFHLADTLAAYSLCRHTGSTCFIFINKLRTVQAQIITVVADYSLQENLTRSLVIFVIFYSLQITAANTGSLFGISKRDTLSQSCFFQNCADSLFLIIHFACTSAYSRRRKRSSASLRDIITSRGLLPTD